MIAYFQDSNGLIRQRSKRTFFPCGANLQMNFCKEKAKLDFSFGVEEGRCCLSDLHLWVLVLKLGKGLIFHVIVSASSLLSCAIYTSNKRTQKEALWKLTEKGKQSVQWPRQ